MSPTANFSKQCEGWLGEEYVRVYAESARQEIASIYAFHEFLPGYEVWGSWGLDALCLASNTQFYRIPWIPLSETHRQLAYSSVEALRVAFAVLHEATPAYENFGKEIHFVTPIVFGGNLNDSSTIAMVDQATHAQLCVYWNRVYARPQAGAQGG